MRHLVAFAVWFAFFLYVMLIAHLRNRGFATDVAARWAVGALVAVVLRAVVTGGYQRRRRRHTFQHVTRETVDRLRTRDDSARP